MNGAHLHLIVNHFPVILSLVSAAVLLYGIVRRSTEATKFALALAVAAALFAPAAYFSGEPAEEVVEGLAGVSADAIEEHEESAELSILAVEALGLTALFGLFRFRHAASLPRPFVIGVALLALLTAGLLARTANLGGQIRHSEIRVLSSTGTSAALT